MNCQDIMAEMERRVEQNLPVSPASWIESALRANMVAGNLDNQVAHIESEMNHIEAEYIKQDMPANKAKTLARSQVNYEEYLKIKALLNRVKEFLSLARRRSQINEF